jgi:hypothetical protein
MSQSLIQKCPAVSVSIVMCGLCTSRSSKSCLGSSATNNYIITCQRKTDNLVSVHKTEKMFNVIFYNHKLILENFVEATPMYLVLNKLKFIILTINNPCVSNNNCITTVNTISVHAFY